MTDENLTQIPEAPQKERLGDKVKRGLNYAANAVGKGINNLEDAFGDAADAGRKKHEEIQARGGYVVIAKEIGRDIADSVRNTYNHVEEGFFTEGSFDSEKAKQTLSRRANAAKEFGAKAYRTLEQTASEGAGSVKKTWREYIPSDEEIATKYKGIGTSYSGVLFREHYEDCLAFYEKAKETMPKGAMYRREILRDIKARASGSTQELLVSYSSELTDTGIKGQFNIKCANKMIAAEKLLKSILT